MSVQFPIGIVPYLLVSSISPYLATARYLSLACLLCIFNLHSIDYVVWPTDLMQLHYYAQVFSVILAVSSMYRLKFEESCRMAMTNTILGVTSVIIFLSLLACAHNGNLLSHIIYVCILCMMMYVLMYVYI